MLEANRSDLRSICFKHSVFVVVRVSLLVRFRNSGAAFFEYRKRSLISGLLATDLHACKCL